MDSPAVKKTKLMQEKPLDKAIKNYNRSMGIITETLSSRYAMEAKEIEQKNANLKEELADLRNLCTKEQLAELEYIQKRKGEK